MLNGHRFVVITWLYLNYKLSVSASNPHTLRSQSLFLSFSRLLIFVYYFCCDVVVAIATTACSRFHNKLSRYYMLLPMLISFLENSSMNAFWGFSVFMLGGLWLKLVCCFWRIWIMEIFKMELQRFRYVKKMFLKLFSTTVCDLLFFK